ncbi:MAG TPA: hypothetical protein VGN17_11520 [Bryobacteraceae bacterium]
MSTITRVALAMALLAGLALAHGGFDHVTGVVLTVDKGVVTVKTAKGNENVKVDAKTEFTKGDQKAQASDLLPGMRVVIDVPEGAKEKPPVAHSVKIGVAAAKK